MLRVGSKVFRDGQVGEKPLDIERARLVRILFTVKEDIPIDPVNVCLFRTKGIVLGSCDYSHPIEQAGLFVKIAVAIVIRIIFISGYIPPISD